jgi:holo-[acyl-carrier protein] synthase
VTGKGRYTVGIDLVSIDRMREIIGRWGSRFVERVFTPGEIAYCNGRALPAESFAARFAAKEAFVKAVSCRHWGGLRYRDIEVVIDRSGAPSIVTHAGANGALGRGHAEVSISHAGDLAAAIVVAYWEVES